MCLLKYSCNFSLAKLMLNCSNRFTSKFSNPKMSRIPMKANASLPKAEAWILLQYIYYMSLRPIFPNFYTKYFPHLKSSCLVWCWCCLSRLGCLSGLGSSFFLPSTHILSLASVYLRGRLLPEFLTYFEHKQCKLTKLCPVTS